MRPKGTSCGKTHRSHSTGDVLPWFWNVLSHDIEEKSRRDVYPVLHRTQCLDRLGSSGYPLPDRRRKAEPGHSGYQLLSQGP